MRAHSGKNFNRLMAFAVVAVSAAALSSCTFIGFTTGFLIDTESIHSVEKTQVDSLKPGVWMEISLADTTEKDGRFIRTDGMFRSQYAAHYAAARKELADTITLPAFGTTETAVDTAGHRWKGFFSGFDLSSDMKPLILITPVAQTNFKVLSFRSLKELSDSTGNRLDLATIGKLVQEEEIPAASKGIVIRDSTTTTRINFSDIFSMKIDDNPKEKRVTWIAGLVTGLAMDAVCYKYIVPLVLKNQSSTPFNP